MTWSEFCAWLYGFNLDKFNVQTELLRVIAYQQLTLSPAVPKQNKPIKITDYFKFPTDEKPKPIELKDPKELIKAWKVKI